jgi:hypothetical protein
MHPYHHLALLNEARTQHHWAIVNIEMAALCLVAADGTPTLGRAAAIGSRHKRRAGLECGLA